MNTILPLLLSLSNAAFAQAGAASPAAATAADDLQFNRDIRPILSDNCFHCHGPDRNKRAANLRLDTRAGGKKAVVPGKPHESELFLRITSADEKERMPPAKLGRRPTPQQIEMLKRWIAQGAKWEEHWSFVPPREPPTPTVKGAARVRNFIDAFVLDRLEREGVAAADEADKPTLIRRVTLDLTGLPPTPEELDAYLGDNSPDAYERVVDRLLASPRYGERMVLEWLDAARYADSNGYQQDRTRTMWPWRDWVIAALNDNMPFDRFTVEQIAGDLLPNASVPQRLATGLHRNHMLNGEGGRIAEESRVDYVVDRVDTTATVWLGLTLGCARCHDHKYDPFSAKDYYGLYAYFNNISESGSVDRGGNAAPVMAMPTPKQTERINTLTKSSAELEKQLRDLDKQLLAKQAEWEAAANEDAKLPKDVAAALKISADKRDAKQKKAVADQHLAGSAERGKLANKAEAEKKALKDANDSVQQVMVMDERPKPRDTFVLIRGAYDKYGEKVSPAVPEKLGKVSADAPANRLGLAKWLVDPANPLTARVTVNRIWQVFFGAGLVRTPEDFGVQGEQPTHPELLDRLAVEFVRSGWNVKAMHRLIVTSATYRQSSRVRPELLERDPDNRLLARASRPRLSAFALRDQALFVSGLLVEKVGGPPVQPYQPPGIWEEFSFGKIVYKQDKGESLYRRSLYTYWRRTVAPPNMFDTAGRQVCTIRPTRTNTPLHALTMMNEIAFVEAARAAAQRVLLAPATSTAARIELLFRLATARKPSPAEAAVLAGALERLRAQYRADPAGAKQLPATGESPRDVKLDAIEHAAWTGLANLVLNLDEVVTRN